jgi:hypothetical protein
VRTENETVTAVEQVQTYTFTNLKRLKNEQATANCEKPQWVGFVICVGEKPLKIPYF